MRTLNISSFVFVLLATTACSDSNPTTSDFEVNEDNSVVETVSTESSVTGDNLVQTSSASVIQADPEPTVETATVTEIQVPVEDPAAIETAADVDSNVLISNELNPEASTTVPDESSTQTATSNTAEISVSADSNETVGSELNSETNTAAPDESNTQTATTNTAEISVIADASETVSNALNTEANVTAADESNSQTATTNTTETSVVEDEAAQQNTAIVETSVAAEGNLNSSPDTNEPVLFDSNINLTGVVYTDTETELFWTRSDADGVVAYLIKRDENELATLDALSFYDNTVEPGTTYEYTVQAVKNNEESGTVSSLFLTTPEAAPTINESNAEDLIAQVIPVMQGIPFKEMIDQVLVMEDVMTDTDASAVAIANGFTLQSRMPNPEGFIAFSHTCESGGTAEGGRFDSGLSNYFGTFSNCAIGFEPVLTFSGDFVIGRQLVKYVNNSGSTTNLDLRAFSVTDTDGNVQSFNGDFGFFPGSNSTNWNFKNGVTRDRDENGDIIETSEPFTFISPAFEGRTQILISRISHNRGMIRPDGQPDEMFVFRHDLFADFSMQSPATGNKTITVTTPVVFLADSENNNFTTGQLLITADDGSELLLDADTGDASTVLLSVLTDGVREDRTLVWADAPLIADIHNTPPF